MLRTVSTSLASLALTALVAAPPLTAQSSSSSPRSSSSRSTKPVSTQMVNINTATATEFQTLPGIGAKMAARILDYRDKNGPFKKIEDLMNVRGLGEKNFLKLKAQLTLGAQKSTDK